MPSKKKTLEDLRRGNTVCMSIQFPQDLRALLAREANMRHIGQSTLVRVVMSEWLAQNATANTNAPPEIGVTRGRRPRL